jgi:proteinaceous RNase P
MPPVAAFEAFDTAVAAGEALQPHSCNVLLHLCSGGVTGGNYDGGSADADTAAQAAKVVIPAREAVHPERANTIFNYMMSNDVPRTEMTYTALARIEAAQGEPRKAFDLVRRLVEEQLQPKLRTFAPALHAFCHAGDLVGALEVDAAATVAKIEITEAEYGVMLAAYREAGRWDDAFALLRRLREDIRTIGDAMADEVQRLLAAAPGWTVEASVCVDEKSGACQAQPSGASMQLAAVNLSPKDRADLLAGIGKLAREREADSNFDNFTQWLARKGPLPYLVDGANVGMYNQNFQESKFNFGQVERLMAHLRPGAREIQKERRAQFEGLAAGAEVVAASVRASAAGAAGSEAAEGRATGPGAEDTSEVKHEASASAEAGAGSGVGARGGVEASEKSEKSEATAGVDGKVEAVEAGVAEGAEVDTAAAATDAAVVETAVAFEPLSATAIGAGVPVNFLHVRRVRGGPANQHSAQRCIASWRQGGELFTTPAGSNDDWYWLYAAVASGVDAFLVSNDEMRDHVFQMLPAPKLFQRWKERHQARC